MEDSERVLTLWLWAGACLAPGPCFLEGGSALDLDS